MYGYDTYLTANRNFTAVTVHSHLLEIELFFTWLDKVYPNSKELYQISPKDIKNYLQLKSKNGLKSSTVYKIHGILAQFFDYLWSIDKIPIDPMAKMKKTNLTVNTSEPKEALSYHIIFSLLESVSRNEKLAIGARLMFGLGVFYGVKLQELHTPLRHITVQTNEVQLFTGLRWLSITHELLLPLMKEHIGYQKQIGSPYLFSTRKHKENILAPIERASVRYMLQSVATAYDMKSFSLTDIRRALIQSLYHEKGYTREETTDFFGQVELEYFAKQKYKMYGPTTSIIH